MTQNREELLRRLEAVAPGLAVKEAVEQSSCFVFQDDRVITFNDEIACSMACPVGFTGAVSARPLLDLLAKMAEAEIDLSAPAGPDGEEGKELLIKGKGRRAGITREANITLPVGAVELPKKWRALDPDFTDAIGRVQHCAGKDVTNFALTCVHVTPHFVEACDNFQVARCTLETGVRDECLVKRDSIKHLAGLGMTEVSETAAWLHFRNPSELVISVRREVHEYANLDHLIEMDGTPTTLPGGLAEAVEKAEIFSAQNAENNVVFIELRAGQLRLRAIGVNGWYEERKKVKWSGDPLSFSISPKLLTEITSKANDCTITEGKLKVDGGKFTYVTCLGEVEKRGSKESE